MSPLRATRPPTASWPTAWATPQRASGVRLTLNPTPHIDLFFTILVPLFLILSGSGFIFGGAKAVPVDVSRLKKPRRDWARVGAAGPALNVLMAIGLYRRLERFGLLIIMALVFFVPQLPVPLSAAIFGLVKLMTTPFGVTADVEPLLRRLLFG